MSRPFQARICTWADLSLADVERLLHACSETETLHKALSEILGLDGDLSSNKQALIELDLYTYAVFFARKKSFTADQVSAFFTILKSVHLMCISTPFDNLQETFQYFKELLLRHSINRPPYSTALFTIVQVRDITEYMLNTYFKHFKLYKYAFTKRVQMNLKLSYTGVEVSPEPSQTDVAAEGEGSSVTAEGQGGEEVEEKKDEQEPPAPEEEKDQEKPPPSPKQHRLQQLIASSLSEKMKELQVAVEQELNSHERKLAERISALEATVEGKGKGKKK